MVNRTSAVEEINLSDEEDTTDWNYRNGGGGGGYRDYYSKNDLSWNSQAEVGS